MGPNNAANIMPCRTFSIVGAWGPSKKTHSSARCLPFLVRVRRSGWFHEFVYPGIWNIARQRDFCDRFSFLSAYLLSKDGLCLKMKTRVDYLLAHIFRVSRVNVVRAPALPTKRGHKCCCHTFTLISSTTSTLFK